MRSSDKEEVGASGLFLILQANTPSAIISELGSLIQFVWQKLNCKIANCGCHLPFFTHSIQDALDIFYCDKLS